MRKNYLLLFLLLFCSIGIRAQQIRMRASSEVKTVNQFKGRATRASDQQGVTATLKYERVADMKVPRIGHQIIPTFSGVLVVGGHTTNFALTPTAEVFLEGIWFDRSIDSPHDEGFSIVLNDGRVMVGGGYSEDLGIGQSSRVDIYDPMTMTFTKGPDLSMARAACHAIAVGKGIYVSGNWYEDDLEFDYYDGTSFSPVGFTLPHSAPYLFTCKGTELYVMSPADEYGDPIDLVENNNGELRFPAILYDTAEDEAYYVFWPVYVDYRPLQLPREFRSSDYYCESEKCYFVLASNGSEYMLTAPAPELEVSYMFTDFQIPTKHPVTQESISWRGGVFVNESKQELYLIGASGTAKNQTVHIISYNYATKAWTLSSADGFGYDLMAGSWALLSDGRLMCAGGSEGDNFTARKDVCIFTPTAAGSGEQQSEPADTDTTPSDWSIIIFTKDQKQHEFQLAGNRPEVKFGASTLQVIISSAVQAEFSQDDVVKIAYKNPEQTEIDSPIADRNTAEINYQDDGQLVISKLSEGAAVSIYAMDGRQLRRLSASGDGTCRLDLSALPKGVYLVKTDTITYKIMKR